MDIQLLKDQLNDFTEQQKKVFQTAEVMILLHQRSDFYDELLSSLWRTFDLDKQVDLALVAVGGYGRREMFPLSDLDILILHSKLIDLETEQKIHQFLNILWDCKLQIGSAIRSLTECIEIGKAEISVATNLFESRCILGNKALWQKLMERLYQPDFWLLEPFFTAKVAERKAQYARYHNTSYNLEPDLKHSPGGLRDLHLISWIMLRKYGVYTLEQLWHKGILFPEEFEELQNAQTILFRMRFALHLQLKRYDNRLRFDRQLTLSEQLGFVGDGNQPVETMMKGFFQATQSIAQLSQLLLAAFEQKYIQPLQKTAEKRPLDTLYFIQDQQIGCHNPRILSLSPEKILDLFWHLTQEPNSRISTTLLRHLRLALRKLTQPLSEIVQARERFIQLFKQPQMVSRAIVPMHQFGVLSAYLPQWKAIEGLMQFDMFHLYTVDEHTIRVMLNLEQFAQGAECEKYPLCCELLPTLAEPALLYFAALFHDIGKGKSGDHAEIGAQEMRSFAQQHGFTATQTEYMAWLVAEHLTMSITAQRRDIHDPEVVKAFAKNVKNLTALSALTCLTIADICATNENLWNDWKRSLFTKLFQFTTEQLALGQEKSIDYQQMARQHQDQALQHLRLELSNEALTKLESFWQSCPESYFVRHSATQLVWHAKGYLQQRSLPMVLISDQYARGATEIFVYCSDQPQLFARLAQTLSSKKISIHDAQVLTSEAGLVLDSFIVTEFNGQPLSEQRQGEVQQALLNMLKNATQKGFKLQKNPIKHRSFKRKTKVRFLQDSSFNQTAFELVTLDREGLLAHIGYIFSQHRLTLVNAKITTVGEKVEDFFVIKNAKQSALSAEEKNALTLQILSEFDEPNKSA